MKVAPNFGFVHAAGKVFKKASSESAERALRHMTMSTI
jgi:hypothetical protein